MTIEIHSAYVRRIAAAAMLFALGACAVPPGDYPASALDKERLEAEGVLAAGFASIQDKYIEDIPLQEITFESVRGLAAIDPALTVDRDGNNIILKRHNRIIVTAAFPARSDAHTWGETATFIAFEAARHSVDLQQADPETIYQAMFDGALAELDIYSRYAGAAEADRNRANRDGFGGVGIRFRVGDTGPVVTEVIADSPADHVGILVDDVIVAVGENPTDGLDTKAVMTALRGPVRSKVRLAIRRPHAGHMAFMLQRSHIVPPTVSARVTDGIMHIRVKSFNQGTAQSLTRLLNETEALVAGDVSGIVLDLRGNPGGLLKQSIEVADVFLAAGKILDTLGRHPDSIQHYEAAGRDFADGLPVVVLIDGRSASAAEIVAAALQDGHRAVVVGTSSYGKGTVQTVVRLPNDGEITLTWSRFMAPSGYALHGLGVFPVVCTSSASDIDPAELLAALSAEADTAATLGTWRKTGVDKAAARRELRAKCPPERRRQDYDLRIARSLLTDGDLYGRALEIATNADRPTGESPAP